MQKKFTVVMQFLILLFIVVVGLIIIGFLVLRADPKQVYNSPVATDADSDLNDLNEEKLNQQLNADKEADNKDDNATIENNNDQDNKNDQNQNDDKVETLEPETKQEEPVELNEKTKFEKPIDPIKDDKKINIDNLF